MSRFTVHGLAFEVAGFSEQGPRDENQDAFSVGAFPDVALLAVADGMGGEKSGRAAADTALEALRECAPIRSLDEARRAMRQADRLVATAAQANPADRAGMGCALALLSLANGADGPYWVAANVGDVRILSRSPDGLLRLETRDHTPAFARWEAGEIALDEIPDTTGANRLQRAVGRGGEADVLWIPAAPGWSWLIVTDGVTKAMRLDELGAAMAAPTAEAAVEAIRQKVQDRGPDDNFTAILARALGPHAAAPVTVQQTNSMPNSTPPTSHDRPRRSAAAGLALIVGLVALGVSAFALWTARETRAEANQRLDQRMEIEALRSELDSLRSAVRGLADPFGPSGLDRSPVTPPTSATSP